MQALNRGVYSKINFTYGQLKNHGNFGIGTFVDLAGEMVALDGKFYQMNSDGTINLVNGSAKCSLC